MQLNALSNVGGLLLAAVGGALTPVQLLPAWVRHIAPISPVYWALKGLHSVITEPHGFSSVGDPAAVLAGFALGALLLSLAVFHADQTKEFLA